MTASKPDATPRTDALLRYTEYDCSITQMIDLARQLERELSAARALGRQEGLEEAAKVCEGFLYDADQSFLEKRGDEERVPYETGQAIARQCASEIRALKDAGGGGMSHSQIYLAETAQIAIQLDADKIEQMVKELVSLRERGGRLFIIGLGGSAANASHAVNDFRRLCSIEAYTPLDNVAELTAAANDDGWGAIFESTFRWMNRKDCALILSVGGGSAQVSMPLSAWARASKQVGSNLLGIVGRDGGETAKHADVCIIVPTVEPSRVTPHTEGWQSVILHAIVSHPDLQRNPCKW